MMSPSSNIGDAPRKNSSPRPHRFYAVIDAAQDATFLFLRDGAAIRRQSLYAGELGAMLDDVAPHLVEFKWDSGFGAWLAERWDRNCGITLQSDAPFEDVRKHLRRFLLVKNEKGARFRFRFYDPRVLRDFLPSCTPDEAAQFFGPTQQIRVPDSVRQSLQFTVDRQGLKSVRVPRDP